MLILDNLLKNTFKNIFIPGICSSCGKISEDLLCKKCRSSITEISGPVCNSCGIPLSPNSIMNSSDVINIDLFESKHDVAAGEKSNFINSSGIKTLENNKLGCTVCRNSKFSFYRLRSFGIYSGILKKLIIKFKYNKIYSIAPVLSGFLKETFDIFYKDEKIDFIETVPDFYPEAMELRKSLSTGANHMKLLTEIFSREVKLPYFNNIIKIRKTIKQQNLGMHEREVNLRGVFKSKNVLNVIGRNILILDDVLTTGSTLNEIAIMLKRCGAAKIYLLTLARAI